MCGQLEEKHQAAEIRLIQTWNLQLRGAAEQRADRFSFVKQMLLQMPQCTSDHNKRHMT